MVVAIGVMKVCFPGGAKHLLYNMNLLLTRVLYHCISIPGRVLSGMLICLLALIIAARGRPCVFFFCFFCKEAKYEKREIGGIVAAFGYHKGQNKGFFFSFLFFLFFLLDIFSCLALLY